MTRTSHVVAALLLAAQLGCRGVTADDEGAGSARRFFEGATLTYIVATEAGGGYDTYARLLARHLAPHLGVERIVVKNVPGGGHVRGAREIASARPDGLDDRNLQHGVDLRAGVEPRRATGRSARAHLGGQGRRGAARARGVGPVRLPRHRGSESRAASAAGGGERCRQRRARGGHGARACARSAHDAGLRSGLARRATQHDAGRSGPGSRLMERGPRLRGERPRSRRAADRHGRRTAPTRSPRRPSSCRPTTDARCSISSARRATCSGGPRRRRACPPDRLEHLRAAYLAALNEPGLLDEARRLGLPVRPMHGDALSAEVSRVVASAARHADLLRVVLDATGR